MTDKQFDAIQNALTVLLNEVECVCELVVCKEDGFSFTIPCTVCEAKEKLEEVENE